MVKLNLPEFDYKLKKAEGKVWIFDVIRKKYIVLTPEEWVRQHFVHFLVAHRKYPRSLIRLEGGLSYNQMRKRTDIVVFDRYGGPWMVIECKAPDLPISTSTLQQVSTYNATHKAKYIAVVNGFSLFCAATDWINNTTTVLNDLPVFEEV